MIKSNEGVCEESVKENQLQKMSLHFFFLFFNHEIPSYVLLPANGFTGSKNFFIFLLKMGVNHFSQDQIFENWCQPPTTWHQKNIFLKPGTRWIVQNTGKKIHMGADHCIDEKQTIPLDIYDSRN